jgi:hypothetical protein
VTLSHGTAVDIEFNLPGVSTPIEAKAKLAWSGPDGLAGLSLEEMHPVPQRELQQWLLERARSEGWVETPA